VVSTTYLSQDLALILAKTTGIKAVLSGEAIYHPYIGEGGPGSQGQWWGNATDSPSATSRQVIINLIDWLLQ
jgi:hypothetical protein